SLATIRRVPLREESATGERERQDDDLPREIAWRLDGKGISYLLMDKKAGGEGDSEGTDRLMLLEPPFQPSSAKAIATSARRISRVSYARDGKYAIGTLTQRTRQNKRREEIVAFELGAGQAKQTTLVRSYDPEDITKAPGSVMTRATGNGVAYALLSRD